MSVTVRGLEETSRAFRSFKHGLPQKLQKGMKAIADHVVGVAQQKMPFITGEAAKGLKPRATQKGAGIAFPGGGTPWEGVKADYYPWLDFGGTTGRGHVANGHNGFGGAIKRPRITGGRYLYPAIGESRGYISNEMDGLIERLAHENSFTTSGHV